MKTGTEPSQMQWINRLIEYTDNPFPCAVRFEQLVNEGYEPEVAFSLVITKGFV